MFLCRTGRRSAAALDQLFKSTSLLQVRANSPRDVTLTLRKGHTAHRCLCGSVRGVGPTVVHLKKPAAEPLKNWDTSTGFVIGDWGHLGRVSAVAVNLSRSLQSEGGFSGLIRQRPSSRGGPAGNALFTGDLGVSSRRFCTRTMQTRSSQTRSTSTAAATKKSEERAADSNKEEEQNLKEASTTPSSTEQAPREPEPEGGKPTKAQQLKKVFKEYGAVGVSFHIGISLMSLGMFYLLISSGIDMASLLCKLGFSEAVVQSKMAAGTSTFVLAYAIHKLFAPVRISITLVSVPLIVRYFRKTGLFKPPTPAP